MLQGLPPSLYQFIVQHDVTDIHRINEAIETYSSFAGCTREAVRFKTVISTTWGGYIDDLSRNVIELFVKDAEACGWKIKGANNIHFGSIHMQIYGDCVGIEQAYTCARRFYIPPSCIVLFESIDNDKPKLNDVSCTLTNKLRDSDIEFIKTVVNYWEALEGMIDKHVRFPNEENNITFNCIDLDYNNNPKQLIDGTVGQLLDNNKQLTIVLSEYTCFKFETDRHMLKVSM
jgi:hypothetical protein